MTEAWVDFTAGWASGAISVLTCQPVDTVLTRLQAGTAVGNNNVSVQARGLVSNFGMTSLWRGSSAMISAVPMQNALLMGGYGIGKQWSVKNNANQSVTLMSVFVGGCTGGIIQSFLMAPVELMKVNQQILGKTAREAGMELLRGRHKSWRGLNATLLRDGIPHGVWFASYEWCKTALGKRLEGSAGAEQVTVPLTSGAFAATVAWAVGYPFDIIKTRIQASNPNSTLGIYRTALELMEEANGSPRGLYRGFGLKLVRTVPASMIGFTTYEFVAAQIRKQ